MAISTRSANAAKRLAAYENLGPIERLPYFTMAQKSKEWWILRNGKWRPRKDGWKLSEETKEKMSKVKQIKRSISKNEQLYDDLIATPYGSLIKTFQILNGIDMSVDEFIKTMRKAEFPFLEDEKFIEKTLAQFNYNYEDIDGKPVLKCGNEFNVIFCPFIVNTENGEIVALPLFKDCRLLRSQELSMANDTYQIIDWRKNENN